MPIGRQFRAQIASYEAAQEPIKPYRDTMDFESQAPHLIPSAPLPVLDESDYILRPTLHVSLLANEVDTSRTERRFAPL